MLISMNDILQPTREHRFAIVAFNVADSCFIRAVVEEAEATRTPAIISMVMIDGSLLPYEENVTLTHEVVWLAHAVGVSVEGEMSTIGQTGNSVKGGVSKIIYTDPAQARDFITRTSVDTLRWPSGSRTVFIRRMLSRRCKCIFRAIFRSVCRSH